MPCVFFVYFAPSIHVWLLFGTTIVRQQILSQYRDVSANLGTEQMDVYRTLFNNATEMLKQALIQQKKLLIDALVTTPLVGAVGLLCQKALHHVFYEKTDLLDQRTWGVKYSTRVLPWLAAIEDRMANIISPQARKSK